jgi:hypothetical protein
LGTTRPGSPTKEICGLAWLYASLSLGDTVEALRATCEARHEIVTLDRWTEMPIASLMEPGSEAIARVMEPSRSVGSCSHFQAARRVTEQTIEDQAGCDQRQILAAAVTEMSASWAYNHTVSCTSLLDNSSTHSTSEVCRWAQEEPAHPFDYTPTSVNWT